MGAIKGVLASFCVLDEERRFELFQLSARLEARWALALPPALMHAITEQTSQMLYKRALQPHLLRERYIDAEGEVVLDAQWLIQEVPRVRNHVLFVVTNRAIYMLENSRLGGMCQVCEPWKLCPSGPRLVRRVALYKVAKLTLDFTAAYHAGHRIKIQVTGDLTSNGFLGFEGGDSPGGGPLSCGGRASGPGTALCPPCAADRKETSHKAAGDKSSSSALALPPSGAPPRRPAGGGGGVMSELQFSSLYVGVVQRIANVIRSGAPARPPPIVLDTHGPRAIQVHRARAETYGGRRSKHGKGDMHVENDVSQMFHCLVALRCEKLSANGKADVRMLLVTETHVELYEEDASLFGTPLLLDSDFGAYSGRDGLDACKLTERVEIDNLGSLDLEMSAEPRARLAESGGKEILLEFADDTGAMLFRHHMRRALWGRGQVGWTATSLGGERS